MPARRPAAASLVVPLVLAASMGLSAIGPGAPPAAAATAGESIFGGKAYGTFARLENRVLSGKSALILLGCGVKTGASRTNFVSSAGSQGMVTAGTVATRIETEGARTAEFGRTVAEATDVNVLDGKIRAEVVRAAGKSIRSLQTGALRVTGRNSSFTGLLINGSAYDSTPDPNTRVNIPGVGYAILNEQIPRLSSDSASITINMIHVHLTRAFEGLSEGSEIIVSHAVSRLTRGAGPLGGIAYGTAVAVGQVLQSGPSFPAYQPCLGTDGVLRTNPGGRLDVPSVLAAGANVNGAIGTVDPRRAQGEMISRIKDLSMLGGVVTADVVRADGTATKDAAGRTFSDAGSRFVNLVVQGHPGITDSVARNREVSLPVGTLTLHRVIRTPNSIEVRMIELVTSAPVGDLPAGTTIVVGVARSVVR